MVIDTKCQFCNNTINNHNKGDMCHYCRFLYNMTKNKHKKFLIIQRVQGYFLNSQTNKHRSTLIDGGLYEINGTLKYLEAFSALEYHVSEKFIAKFNLPVARFIKRMTREDYDRQFES